ncbi:MULTISPECIES: LAETG motif-containing sortase-dependent surface protein [Streptomycetaceae]|nr:MULTISPECIES: LAETG motif-containing sortase-dependent surface protein [Streptomycetaceae]MYS60709.1 LPXTG cell wall anchor domain-containing protein [Streptomyces sp. SID5468]CCB76522.1 conserved exported protein of unknown function [Streptantibioticus cattleyicolor NRRL 8057 = DSM 46488]
MAARRSLTTTASASAALVAALCLTPTAAASAGHTPAPPAAPVHHTTVRHTPAVQAVTGPRLADTGGVDTTPYVIGGTVFLGMGAALLVYARRRALPSY